MTIHMTPRLQNGLALLDVRGSLAARAADEHSGLAATVAQLADAGFAEIAVNLAEVTRVDAGGLGELVLALRAAHDRGARLTLVAAPLRVRHLLTVTRLDTVIDVTESFGPTESFGSFGPFGSFGSFGFEGSDRSMIR